MTALGALMYCPDLHARFLGQVRELSRDPASRVRARALEFLFQHGGGTTDEWRERTFAAIQEPSFRSSHPRLVSLYLSDAVERSDDDAVTWALGVVEAQTLQETDMLQPLLDHAELLAPHRMRLVDALATANAPTRTFLLSALTRIDGQMRQSLSPAH